jgi:hypothetical protein
MHTPNASLEPIAREFQRRIHAQEEVTSEILHALDESTLSQTASLGRYFFNALEALVDQPLPSNSGREVPISLDTTLRAIYRYGLSWDADLLQDRGFTLLSQLYHSSEPARISPLSSLVISVISHLSPRLDIEQVIELLESERNQEALSGNETTPVKIDIYSQLAMSSPREIFLQHAGFSEASNDIDQAFEVASLVLQNTVSSLSDACREQLFSLVVAFRNMGLAISGTGLLIPALLSTGADPEHDLLVDIESISDSLSWIVESGIPSNPNFVAQQKQIEPSMANVLEQPLNLCRMTSWAILSLLLGPDSPWEDRCSEMRERLCVRAKSLLERSPNSGSASYGQIALELFLASADPAIRSDEIACAKLHARLCDILEGYNSLHRPLPSPVDGLIAAIAAWQIVSQGAGSDRSVQRLRETCKSALRGKLFYPQIQGFLVRAATERDQ